MMYANDNENSVTKNSQSNHVSSELSILEINPLITEGEEDNETTLQIIIKFLKLAFPAIICNMVFNAQILINIRAASKLQDPTVLAGIGLGNMTITLACNAILMKLNRAMESLVPQAFGRGDMQLCGVFLNRARFMVIIAFLPIIALVLNAKHLYILLQ